MANVRWIMEKAREFQKNIYICFSDYVKAFLYAGQEATVRTGHGTTTGSKQEEEYVKAVYGHPAYLTYMQSASCRIPGWIKYIWNKNCQEKY